MLVDFPEHQGLYQKRFCDPPQPPEVLRWAGTPCASWCEEAICADLAARAKGMTQERAENARDGTGHSSSPAPASVSWARRTLREKEGTWRERNLSGLSSCSEETEFQTRKTALPLLGEREEAVPQEVGTFSYWEVNNLTVFGPSKHAASKL